MLLALKGGKFMESICLKTAPAQAENQDFLTCQSAKTASIKAAATAGISVHTTYGKNVEPKNLIL